MAISPFFRQLQTGYQAELDDLCSDSEGKDVLRKRLADKRKEIGFLVQMIELSPEMVAVVLHQAFTFTKPAVMDHLLSLESDELLPWDALQDAVKLAPWAQPLQAKIAAEPMGEWFMVVAAALEYMHSRPMASALSNRSDDAEDEGADGANDRDNPTEDHDEDEQEARAREEAGNDWLADQGFDRKD